MRLPKSPGPFPVVVVIHGGFWQAAYDLEHLGPLCTALAAEGWASFSLAYQRTGNTGGGWPGTFQDIAAGVESLRHLASDHDLDLKRVTVLGHSAGGHLALWAAARHCLPIGNLLSHSPALPLRGVVSLAGIGDLRRASEMGLGQGAVASLLGGSPDEFPERYSWASPAELLPLGIAQKLRHGQNDQRVPFDMSEKYHKRASAR